MRNMDDVLLKPLPTADVQASAYSQQVFSIIRLGISRLESS